MKKILKGDALEILPEWQDEGDGQFDWRAIEDEDGGRVLIAPINTGLFLPSTSRIQTHMVRHKQQVETLEPSLAPK